LRRALSLPQHRLVETLYDLVRIGGWALLVFGAVIVALGAHPRVRKAA